MPAVLSDTSTAKSSAPPIAKIKSQRAQMGMRWLMTGCGCMAIQDYVSAVPRAMTTLPVRTVSMISNLLSMRTAASILSLLP